jgi:hypothetical protein
VRWETVPDQNDRAVPVVLVHFGEKFDQRFIVVSAGTRLEEEVSVTAIWLEGQHAGGRQPCVAEPMVPHRRLASGCPGGPHRRQQRHFGLVLKQDQCVLAPCRFFNCGRRFLIHCSIASSSGS